MADDENANVDAESGELTSTSDPRTGVITGKTFPMKIVKYSAVDGDAIFEGDIVLGTVEQMEAAFEAVQGAADPRAAIKGVGRTGSQYRWPDGKIAYQIAPTLPDKDRVSGAIAHWEEKTKIRFVQRTTEANYVVFTPSNACNSEVGMQGGAQIINLGPQCTKGNAIHEIGHTVGLWHEQSREDREKYIKIDYTNVSLGKQHNFNQHINDGDDIGAYDYGSVMHYSAYAFALDQNKPTIITPNGEEIGQRDGLSPGDIEAVNVLYGF